MKYTETHIYICTYTMLKLGLSIWVKYVVKYWLSLLPMQCLRPGIRKGHIFFFPPWSPQAPLQQTLFDLLSAILGLFFFFLFRPVWAILWKVGLSICKKDPWLERITMPNHGLWLCTLRRLRDLSKIMVICNWIKSYQAQIQAHPGIWCDSYYFVLNWCC